MWHPGKGESDRERKGQVSRSTAAQNANHANWTRSETRSLSALLGWFYSFVFLLCFVWLGGRRKSALDCFTRDFFGLSSMKILIVFCRWQCYLENEKKIISEISQKLSLTKFWKFWSRESWTGSITKSGLPILQRSCLKMWNTPSQRCDLRI